MAATGQSSHTFLPSSCLKFVGTSRNLISMTVDKERFHRRGAESLRRSSRSLTIPSSPSFRSRDIPHGRFQEAGTQTPMYYNSTTPNALRDVIDSLRLNASAVHLGKCFSYQPMERSRLSTMCLGSRIPCPSRGYLTITASTPTSFRAM